MAGALLRGDIDMAFEFYAAVHGLLADNKIVALASAGASRTAYLPQVPTVIESGLTDYEVTSWNGLSAPASTPARIIATQFMFVPRCIAVPRGRPVTLRFASPDVIHGLLISGTNVNTMVVPGFVAQVHTEFTRSEDVLMPCHEYCGLGHSEMWATVQVMTDDRFKPAPDGRVSCAQR